MSAVDLVDTRDQRPLVTPEGVDLRVRLAGLSERAGALMIDCVLIVIALVILTLTAVGAATLMKFKNAEIVAVIWLLGSFLLRNAWFIVFELGSYAATPGKRAVGLRVAMRNGGRLTAEAVVVRNAMRELEMFLPLVFILSGGAGQDAVDGWMYLLGVAWVGVFALFPFFNRDHLRVGDLVAGTWVVRAPREVLLKDLADSGPAAAQERFPFTRDQLDAYGVKELHVLEDVLRTADRKVMRAVADRIRGKIGWISTSDETDQAFLAAYYAALRGRLESRLLMGRRKRDKFDRD